MTPQLHVDHTSEPYMIQQTNKNLGYQHVGRIYAAPLLPKEPLLNNTRQQKDPCGFSQQFGNHQLVLKFGS